MCTCQTSSTHTQVPTVMRETTLYNPALVMWEEEEVAVLGEGG